MRAALAWLTEWAPLIWTSVSVVALVRIAQLAAKLFIAHRKLRAITEGPTHQSRSIRRLGLMYGVLALFLLSLIYIGVDPIIRPDSPGLIPGFITLVVLLCIPPMLLLVAEWVWRAHSRD